MIQWLKRNLHPRRLGAWGGSILTVLAGVALLLLPQGKGLRDWSFDLPFLCRPDQRLTDVVVIYLDEKTYSELAQDPASFDRAIHAKLVRRLTQEGARLVCFDVLFIDKSRPVTDSEREFAAAMKESGRVVLAAQYFEDAHFHRNSTVWPPIDPLRDAAAGWGLARLHRDADFASRLIAPGTDRIPSMAWRSVEVAGEGAPEPAGGRLLERWLNYYSNEPLQGISYSDVVSGKPLPPGFSFRDKVVYVGSGEVAGFMGQEKEQFRSPWTWLGGRFPLGVELHAITHANLVRGDWMTRMPIPAQLLLIVVLGATAGLAASRLKPLAATGAAVAAAVAVTGLGIWMSGSLQIWWSWLIVPAAQLPVALGWCYLSQSIRSHVQSRVLESSLERYLSPEQVREILSHPELLKPGATPRTVSILFSDIAGFSRISERMDPEDLVRLLNAYYETAIHCIRSTGGTVMNLVGDAIFAIWNAPVEQPGHAALACEAALRLQEALARFEAGSQGLPLHTAVGLHTGVACVGNIGSRERFIYTAVGESVNMASRLEGLSKHLGTRILATRETQKAIGDRVVSRHLGHFKFKGFDQVVEVHEIIDTLDKAAESAAWRETFATALNRLQRRAFAEAAEGFQRTLQLRAGDGPSLLYLRRVEEWMTTPPPPEWVGEVNLEEK